MSDSSRVQLSAVEEVTWGVTPASTLEVLRYNSESFGTRKEHTRSDEVRSDRMVSDVVPVGENSDGGFDFEMSFAAHDMFYQAALASSDFSTDQNFSATTVDAANADSSFNDSGSGFPTLVQGQWIYVNGFTNAANNGYFEVVSRTASKIVVAAPVSALITESAGNTIEIHDSTIINGTQTRSFTFQKHMADASQYFGFPGVRVNTLSLSFASRQKVTGSIGTLGKQGILQQSQFGTGISTPFGNPIMNASSNVGQVLEGGAVLSSGVHLQTLNVEYSNNVRVVDAIGQQAAVEIGLGRFTCTGDYTALFEDEVLFDKYLNSTTSSLNTVATDSDGNTMVFSFPSIRYTNGDILGTGNDDEVVANLEWEAILTSAQNAMVRIDKFAA